MVRGVKITLLRKVAVPAMQALQRHRRERLGIETLRPWDFQVDPANRPPLRPFTTVDELCASCHTEKRGPYLWEHAPVANACVTCHDPHGSNNQRMLVAKVPFLCQRCHVTSRHPPTVYDGFVLRSSASANRLIGSGCVVCHVQIHGSNAPSGKYLHR